MGIITFTVDAIVEDPISAVELMRRVQAHPFWDFYVHPAVLSAATQILQHMPVWQ